MALPFDHPNLDDLSQISDRDASAAAGPEVPRESTKLHSSVADRSANGADPVHRRIVALEQQLILAQRRAQLGVIAGGIAHEINNLMTPVLTRADFALSIGRPDDLRAALERTLEHGRRVIDVAQSLLGYVDARCGPPQPVSVNVPEAVAQALALFVRPFEKDGHTVTVDVPATLTVLAQPGAFPQLLANLLFNAREALEDLRGSVVIAGRRAGPTSVLSICDSGSGFDPAELERCREFFATDPRADLSDAWPVKGLGLRVCRILAAIHGATIDVAANEGRGTAVTIRWPAADPTAVSE